MPPVSASSLRPRSSVNKSRVESVPEENSHKIPSRPTSGVIQQQRKRSEDLRASLPPLNGISSSKSSSKPPPKTPTMTCKLPKLNNVKKSAPLREKSQPTSLPPLTARSGSSSFSTAHGGGEDLMLLRQQSVVGTRHNSVISTDGCKDSESVATTAEYVVDYSFLVVQLDKAVVEWKRQYAKRILQVIVIWLRSQLDQLRYSIVPPSNHKVSSTTTSSTTAVQHYAALFLLQAQLNSHGNGIEMTPSLDDIQEVINLAGKTMLSLAKGYLKFHQKFVEFVTYILFFINRRSTMAATTPSRFEEPRLIGCSET